MLVVDAHEYKFDNNQFNNFFVKKILVIDSVELDIYRIKSTLQKHCENILLSSHTEDFLSIIENEEPDIIYFHLNDSIYSYKDILKKIKSQKETNTFENIYTPYLVLVIDENIPVNLYEDKYVGVYDDICQKPYIESIIYATLKVWKKTKSLQEIIEHKNHLINKSAHLLNQEMELASSIINNLIRKKPINFGNINYSQFPMEILSGDIFLITFDPRGNQFILVGDLTGHGLAAAVGAMVVYDIFYSMVNKGHSLSSIAKEINAKLKRIQNTGRFMCACLIELDINNNHVHILNAGLPNVLLKGKEKGVKSFFKSENMPLGVIGSEDIEFSVSRSELEQGDKIYIYTDGLNEIVNTEGERLGNERIKKLFFNDEKNQNLFDSILNLAYSFSHNAKRTDDITLVEVTCDKTLLNVKEELKFFGNMQPAMDWGLDFEFSSEVLKRENPLPLILQSIIEIQGLRVCREHIYTILAEMFSNALEHGLLGLESNIKKDADGFAQYYSLREKRLEKLEGALIKIKISHQALAETSGKLIFQLSHNGKGFDYEDYLSSFDYDNQNSMYGRGIKLIKELASDFRYSQGGKCLEVDYSWSY